MDGAADQVTPLSRKPAVLFLAHSLDKKTALVDNKNAESCVKVDNKHQYNYLNNCARQQQSLADQINVTFKPDATLVTVEEGMDDERAKIMEENFDKSYYQISQGVKRVIKNNTYVDSDGTSRTHVVVWVRNPNYNFSGTKESGVIL